MHQATLLAEIDWRIRQRGTKELTARLEHFFASERENNFDGWSQDELRAVINFLKQDEQFIMDIFLKPTTISKAEFRIMIKK
ncbi:MAG: succinate dehydrogenase assembly factor 2 [Hydrotalea sp.]|nr:succinate dehydrogenase assembly factor 2 [Hydrotalea sp.]